MKHRRFQGTNLRALAAIVGVIFVALLVLGILITFAKADHGKLTYGQALLRSVAIAGAFSVVCAIALAAALPNEYIEVGGAGLRFKNSKDDGFCPWDAIATVQRRKYKGMFGGPFVCHVLVTEEREFCFGRVFLPDEFLPSDLQPGNLKRVFVGIEKPDELLMVVSSVLSSGSAGFEVSSPPEGTSRGTEASSRRRTDGMIVPGRDYLLAFALAALCPVLVLLCGLIRLPLRAPPVADGDYMVFRYSVGGFAEGLGAIILAPAVFAAFAFVLVCLGGLSGHIRTRPLAWTMFALAASVGVLYGGWSINNGYSSEYEFVLTERSLYSNDPAICAEPSATEDTLDSSLPGQKTETEIFWDEVKGLLVHPNLRGGSTIYSAGAPPERETVNEIKETRDQAGRVEGGYLVILTAGRFFRLPNTI
ncbi:hypothetical protein ACFL2Q_01135 [Thermodesulfobacteriota bacterium]